MGAGIAQVSAQAGFETIGREVSEELCERARGTIEHYLGRAVEKEKLTAEERDAALGRLTFTTNLADLAGCDLVIEAIVEELEPKRDDLRGARADRGAGRDSCLEHVGDPDPRRSPRRPSIRSASSACTSSIPAPLLPLVEIIQAERSSDEAVNAAYEWAEQAGKQPVRANDTPGFIVNRVLVPTLNECIRLLDEGVTPEDLDKAMTMGMGWPMGPCTLVDLVGIDIHIHAAEAMYEATGDERAKPPDRLREMAAEGRLGRKSGRGFYEYPN